MNIINKLKKITKDISTVSKEAEYIKEKKEAIKRLIDETNTSLVPTQEKIDEKLQELKTLKENIVHSTITEFHKHLKDTHNRENFGFEAEEFGNIVTALHQSEEKIVEVQSIDIVQKLNTQVTFIEKLNDSLTKDEVDYYHSQAVEYSLNIENIINNYSEIIRLIYNTITLIKRYEVECNKLNKQTDHIREQIGDDYSSYSTEQKFLIQKHIYYTSKLLELINSPVMLEDGSFNNQMIDTLTKANQFLKNAEKIEFVNFKKRTSRWIYLTPAFILASIALYFLFISLQNN